MSTSIDEYVTAFSRRPGLEAYDLDATFGEGSPGRIAKRLVDSSGKFVSSTQTWEAGEVAYQCLKQLYPQGMTEIEFIASVNDFYSMVCNDVYPEILKLGEAGKLDIRPRGLDGMKEAWAEYDWCQRVMFAFDFIDGLGASNVNPLNAVLPLVLLQRLDDVVIAEFLDGRGLSEAMLEVASLRDRLQPPKHVQIAVQKLQVKLDTFLQARRKGADVLHAEHRAMKEDVFVWLDQQREKFKSNEAAASAITRQQPIAHVTARDWYKEWKKMRSASTP